jgi:hypothetical protein
MSRHRTGWTGAFVVVLLAGCACDVPRSSMSARGDAGGAVLDGAPAPDGEHCGDGLDGDRDERIDEGCACAPGETQACVGGAPGPHDAEGCGDGIQTCGASGTEWGDWGDAPCRAVEVAACDAGAIAVDGGSISALADGGPPLPSPIDAGALPTPVDAASAAPDSGVEPPPPDDSCTECNCTGFDCVLTVDEPGRCVGGADSAGHTELCCPVASSCEFAVGSSGGTTGVCRENATCVFRFYGSGGGAYRCDAGSSCDVSLDGSGLHDVDCTAARHCEVSHSSGVCTVVCGESCRVIEETVTACEVRCADGSAARDCGDRRYTCGGTC